MNRRDVKVGKDYAAVQYGTAGNRPLKRVRVLDKDQTTPNYRGQQRRSIRVEVLEEDGSTNPSHTIWSLKSGASIARPWSEQEGINKERAEKRAEEQRIAEERKLERDQFAARIAELTGFPVEDTYYGGARTNIIGLDRNNRGISIPWDVAIYIFTMLDQYRDAAPEWLVTYLKKEYDDRVS